MYAANFLATYGAWFLTLRRCRSPAKAASWAEFGLRTRTSMWFASTADTRAEAAPAGISISTAGVPTCSRGCGCLPSYTAKKRHSTIILPRSWNLKRRLACGVTTSVMHRRNRSLAKFWWKARLPKKPQPANALPRIQARRAWDRKAEDNVADRLQRLGLMA